VVEMCARERLKVFPPGAKEDLARTSPEREQPIGSDPNGSLALARTWSSSPPSEGNGFAREG